jgi:hypothetical protein
LCALRALDVGSARTVGGVVGSLLVAELSRLHSSGA